MLNFPTNWSDFLDNRETECKIMSILQILKSEYNHKTIYPPKNKIFKSLEITSPSDLKIVIIGQDPYHGEGMANGLAFSVDEGIKIPQSLKNIYKEIDRDLGKAHFNSGSLEGWAKQGVLLLNSTFTVEKGKANSHKHLGWDSISDDIIKKISAKKENIVFMLWGAFSQKKRILIDGSKHLILECAHPSPLSVYRGFWGCGHFGIANKYLENRGLKAIKW